LAWKNAILKVRQWQTLLLEIAVPVVIIIALGGVKNVIGQTTYQATYPANYHEAPTLDDLYTTRAPLCAENNLVYNCLQPAACLRKFDPKYLASCQLRKIAVAPADPTNAAAATAAQSFVAFVPQISPMAAAAGTFQYFPSEQAFLAYVGTDTYAYAGDVYSSAVIFKSGAPGWDYTVRVNQTYYAYGGRFGSPDTGSPAEDISVISPSGGGQQLGGQELVQFAQVGVYALMDAVHSFAATQAACAAAPAGAACPPVVVHTAGVAYFPNPKITDSGFWGGIGFLFALLMIIALLLPLSNVIKALVQEKETKMREGMLMMALRGDALWLSWVMHFLALFLPLSILLTVAGGQLFQYSNPFYIWCYFMVFFISSMSYGILISAVFSKSRTAAIIGNLVFFMGFFIFIGMISSKPSRGQILAACLHPAAAFTFGTNAFAEYEGARVGVTANTWNVSKKFNVTFQDCLNMMLADAIWMLALSWYLAQVLPSEFGTHRPWYFLVTPAYWKEVVGWRVVPAGHVAAVDDSGAHAALVDTVEPVIDTLSRQVPCVFVSTQRTCPTHLVTSSFAHPLPACR